MILAIGRNHRTTIQGLRRTVARGVEARSTLDVLR